VSIGYLKDAFEGINVHPTKALIAARFMVEQP